MHKVYTLASLLAVFLFLWITAPRNHSEAEDAFKYAWTVEQVDGEFFHAHHLLYAPLMRGLYGVAQQVAPSVRAYAVMRMASMVSGVVCVWLFWAILAWYRREGGKPGAAPSPDRERLPLWGAGALLFSYGFWRYATEVEIYIPGAAAGLWTVWLAARAGVRPVDAAVTAAVAALAVLLHAANVVVAALFIPLLWMFRRRFQAVAVYAGLGVALVGLAYGVAAAAAPLFWQPYDPVRFEGGLRVAALLTSAIGCGQTLLSGNFLFSFPWFREWIRARFPYRMLEEECLMGASMPAWAAVAAGCTFLLAAGLLVWAGVRLVRQGRPLAPGLFWPLVLWLAGQAFLVAWFEPGNPELWIMVLIPFWLFGFSKAPSAPPRLVGWMVAWLALHNAVGGLGPVQDQRHDYNWAKTAWLRSRLQPGESVVTADVSSYWFYLRYHFPGQAYYLYRWPASEAAARLEALNASCSRVWIFHDVFDPPAPWQRRQPASADIARAAAKYLEARVRKEPDAGAAFPVWSMIRNNRVD